MFKKALKMLAIVLAVGGMTASLSACATKDDGVHKIVIHVDDNDKAKMNIALNNAANVDAYYKEKGEEVLIDIVAYGPGLNMLIKGKSPVEKRVTSFEQNFDNIAFKACGNTMKKMTKKEGKAPELLEGVTNVSSGVIRIMELQGKGYKYLRP